MPPPLLFLVVLVLLLARPACSQQAAATYETGATYAYGDYKAYNTRRATANFLKCAGAPGRPYVEYAPCGEGFECRAKTAYGDGDWGLYCLKALATGVCHRTGDRCAGLFFEVCDRGRGA